MATFNERFNLNSNGNSAFAKSLNAHDFFRNTTTSGYPSPNDFLEYGKTLTARDESELRKFISFLKAGYKLDGGSDIYDDKAGLQYRYYRAFKPNSRPGAKVVLSSGIVRLIDDYENGRIKVDFTLDALIEEARKIISID